MNLSTSLAKLKRTMVVAAVLAMVLGITTESAEARRASGRTYQQLLVGFDLETSVSDSNKSRKLGVFSSAILNLTVCDDPPECSNTSLLLSGTISASRIPTPRNRNTEIVASYSEFDDCTFERLINDPNNTRSDKQGFEKAVIKYEVTFGNSPNRLFLFFPSLGREELDYARLVNSLSGTNKFTRIQGIYQVVSNDGSVYNDAIGCGYQESEPIQLESTTSATEITEPSATDDSLAVGTLGSVLMVKHKRSGNIL